MALNSCCCFSLKTGTALIGIFSTLTTVFSFIMTAIAIPQLEANVNNTYNTYSSLRAVFLSVLTYSATLCALSVMLVIGTRNRKAHFIFPYLCLDFSAIIVSITIFVGILAYTFTASNIPFSVILAIILILSSSFALKIYLWMVIYYFYQELLNEQFGVKVNPAKGKILKEPFENDV